MAIQLLRQVVPPVRHRIGNFSPPSTTSLFVQAFSSSPNGENPHETIQGAMRALEDFSSRLIQLGELIDRPHTLPGTLLDRTVTLPEMVLHSRDTSLEDFQSPTAQAARQLVSETTAQEVDQELQQLARDYSASVAPQMEQATRLCQETPCGGATWELDLEALSQQESTTTPGGNQRVALDGMTSTPSIKFLEATYTTKPQVVMGSRALLILNLAMDFNAPLQHIRTSGTNEQNQQIRQTFEQNVVPTPWLRSDEEYQQLLQLQEELKKT
jgi:hypothetical protein